MHEVKSIESIQSTNDFVIKFANVNGSGSASANQMFAKAMFRMGIPVSPKNIFPVSYTHLTLPTIRLV